MEKIKKWIIILIILMILLSLLFVILLATFSSEDGKITWPGTIKNEGIGQEVESVEVESKIVQVKDYNTFYTIENSIQKYFLYTKVGNKQALDEIITEEYKKKNNLSIENIIEHFPKIEEDNEFLLKQLYLNDSKINPTYYAYGELQQKSKKNEYYFIIYTDQTNLCWSIEPIQKQEYENRIKQDKSNEEKTIAKKQYNSITQKTVTKEEIAKKYFKNYIYQAVYDKQSAYELLEPQYQRAKYGNITTYSKYLEERKEELTSMDIYSIKKIEDFKNEDEYAQYIANLQQKGLRQYSIIEEKEYTQYICIDDYGNYYIFRETAPMYYTVILDTYTIDLPEFIEKYNNSTGEEKALMNIQKFFEAINQGDYAYAYTKLDTNFKTNNFKTLQEFENYVKNNFYAKNKLTAEKMDPQGEVYLYKININDKTEQNQNTIIKTFVIQLKEGTDFVMSFEVSV